MTPSTAFRLSNCLPLAIASIALGYAESSILPEVGIFAGLVLLALGVAYRLEPRVPLLNQADANRLGGVIGLIAILWAAFRCIREAKTGEFTQLGWTAFIVALIAPVLLAAVVALLLRRDKRPSDYWFMQAAGLTAIVLAGAMAEETFLLVLTAAYAICAVWFLFQFHAVRRGTPPTGTYLGAAALAVGFAAVLALPLYVLTPRSNLGKLEFGQGRVEIGYAADQMIDLTQTGELRENPEAAFEVAATHPDASPKEDLPGNQRWRGALLITYVNGMWRRDGQVTFPTAPTTKWPAGGWSPPDLGPGSYRLMFTVPTRLFSAFLADPVEWDSGEATPIAELDSQDRTIAWTSVASGSGFYLTNRPAIQNQKERRYIQVTRPSAEPGLSPAYEVTTPISNALRANPVPRVKDYADRVVEDLVRAGRLPRGALDRDPVHLWPSEEHHEAIARAFRDHLSNRADLVYTTTIRRGNKAVDPVEDFLFDSKAGHCERFATALVLMLRSQGIPAVVVLGFKGCEHTGGGRYVIRQEMAHAWGEALISRPRAVGRGRIWHWLSLDPAPAAAEANAENAGSRTWTRAALERLIFHFSPNERERVLKSLGQSFSRWEPYAVLAGCVAAGWLGRRAWQRSAARRRRGPDSWYDELIAMLARRGLRPQPGETPQEFAVRVTPLLPPGVQDVPARWVAAHYRHRFGDAPLEPAEQAELRAELAALGETA
jgi:transglutaminase-like putative cysteine protease